ncbi:hypothetical protein GCM10025794_37810 [Massilia kyonggiensis]
MVSRFTGPKVAAKWMMADYPATVCKLVWENMQSYNTATRAMEKT